LRAEGKSLGLTHLAHCSYLLDRFILKDLAFSMTPIASMKRADLLDLRKRLTAAGNGLNTVNKVVATAKTVLSEAAFRGEIESNVGAEVGEVKYAKRERGVLLPEEVGAMLAFLSERTVLLEAAASNAEPIKKGAWKARATIAAFQACRDEALVAFLFGTGVRAGELRALRWQAIDLVTGRCKIDEAMKGLDGVGLPKWGKVREIALPALVLDRLKTWRDRVATTLGGPPPNQHFVFGDIDGHPLGYEGAHNVLERAIEEARESGVLPEEDDRWLSPHSARHGLNTNLLAAGVAPLLVQSYLGWTSAEGKILTKVQASYTHLQLLRVEDVAVEIDHLYKAPEAKVRARGKG
jgi:integrase